MTSKGTAVRTASPTLTIDGQENSGLMGGLIGLSVAENIAGLYRCEAMFGNWGLVNGALDFVYFDRQTLDFGKPFQVKIDSDLIFEGRIIGLEAQFSNAGERTITVLAEDRFQDLRMTRRTRTFNDVTDSDVFQSIANDHSLTPQVSLPSTQHKVLAQVNMSDLAFLRERARASGAELWIQDRTLYAKARTDRGQR